MAERSNAKLVAKVDGVGMWRAERKKKKRS